MKKILYTIMTLGVVIALFIGLSSCEEPSNQRIAPNIEIGDLVDEGIVFYIYQEGDDYYVEGETHGLVVSDSTLDPKPFGCNTVGMNDLTDDGEYNTNLLNNSCNGSYAANTVYNLSIYGYDDWWLPSEYEFYLILDVVSINDNSYYWTSNRAIYNDAVSIRPIDGDWQAKHINTSLKILPIRRF